MVCQGQPMGFYRGEWGSDGTTLNFNPKQKSRWLFQIQNITSGDAGSGPLPCIRASRPKLQFRQMQAEHLNETISYPSKPDWQPIQIVIYDRCISFEHPIMTWLRQQYDPSPVGCSAWYPCIDPLSFKTCAQLLLLDGCGNIVESWTLEHCYPENVDFGELDMSNMEIITADVTLRYDRAFQTFPVEPHPLYPSEPHPLYPSTTCTSCVDPTCDESEEGGSGGVDNSGGSQNQPSNDTNVFPPGPGGVQTNPGFAPRIVIPDFSMI
jgi:hypothetical protein